MENCWLSPKGEVTYCRLNHIFEAESIVEDLNLETEFVEGPCHDLDEFLGSKGYVKWSKDSPNGWCILPGIRLTKAQIEKIYELTGDFFGGLNGYLLDHPFFIQKISTSVETF